MDSLARTQVHASRMRTDRCAVEHIGERRGRIGEQSDADSRDDKKAKTTGLLYFFENSVDSGIRS